MSSLAPTLEAFFTQRLVNQRRAAWQIRSAPHCTPGCKR